MNDLSLHHGALSVSDMARSIEFYEATFGFTFDTRVIVDGGALEIVHLRKGRSYLELFCRAGAKPLPEHAMNPDLDYQVLGTKHLAFDTADPAAVHAELKRLGVAGLTPVYDGTFYKYFFLKDPDGIVVEIVSRK